MIIQEAESLVNGQRAQDYGDINESFTRIAGMWSAYLGVTITPHDVVNMMIQLKVSRARNSRKYDSFLDIVGYVLCAEKLGLEK